ncbi:hypothetical protein BIFADO_01535 [Bifidobacterium adolescentis L2-32]|uniref:Uncharacterized protein n=1 Tax=Bifidobacterium adolescentis L2-32 TaxID=411481 RepID=A7A6Q2_BIFAD|nr:hypothetical protein BIFADO_01535 [Bifidobacterium adolescentis L2-32]
MKGASAAISGGQAVTNETPKSRHPTIYVTFYPLYTSEGCALLTIEAT